MLKLLFSSFPKFNFDKDRYSKSHCKWNTVCVIIAFIFFFSPLLGYSTSLYPLDKIDVSGTVSDQEGNRLPGVTVKVVGTQDGTTTDSDGNFEISDVDENAALDFSFVGYETQQVRLEGRRNLNITLSVAAQYLDEVVAIGYGTQKRSSVTASISKIENEKLDQIPSGRLETALIGRMAGVNITTLNDRPGTAPQINVRGFGSISAGNSPLIVIDGIPGGSLEQIDMNDVESIEVLKDASSAAIYGSRGAGGVVLVTTKKGTDGQSVISLNSYVGFSKPMLYGDWIMGKEWYDLLAKYQNRAFAESGGDISIPLFGDSRRPIGSQLDPIIYQLPQTDWEKEITRTAPIQNHNLSVRGGNDKIKYYISGTYADEQGVIKTASYKTYSFRANVEAKVNKLIDIGAELSPKYVKQRLDGIGVLINANKYPPFVPPHKVDGKYPRTIDYAFGHSGQASPYTSLYGTRDYNDIFYNSGSAFVNFKLMEGLSFRTSVGANMRYTTRNNYTDGDGDSQVAANGYVNESHVNDLLNENVLNYNVSFNEKHNLEAILGASYQLVTSQNTRMAATSNSFNNDIVQTINNALVNPSASTSSKSRWGLISYFGRLNYDYEGKYLFSASLRRDGSSRFGLNNKWGFFPAVSGAWRITKEDFLQENDILSDLKLRASYGRTGNFNIGDFQYLGAVENVKFSPDNETINGLAQSSIANPDLTWENTDSYGMGIDIGMFNNRLSLSFDYYSKRTDGMLYQINVPAITGFSSAIQNIGLTENKGFEVEIQSRNATGELKWNTFFNFSTNRNEVLNLGDVTERIITLPQGMNWILREGEPMFSFYAYKMTGVFQNQNEIDKTPHLSGTIPGDPIIADLNGDGKINVDDRYVAGSNMPKVNLGMTNEFSWRRFDLSFSVQTALGAKIWDREQLFYQGPNLGSLRRPINNQWWSEDDPGDGRTPGISMSSLYSRIGNTDYYLENASYLNFRNLNIGYDISDLVRSAGIKNLRIYCSVNNLFIITSKEFHAYNPEGTTGGGISGVDSKPGDNSGSAPMSRRFVFGLNLSL